MNNLLTKFRKIHAALEEQRDKPEYIQIFKEIESFLDVNFETISSIEIKKQYEKMEQLNEELPDIDDVENLLASVRF